MSAAEANACTRSIEAWLKVWADAMTAEVVEDLRREVKRLKDQIGARPSVRVV
ncbi:MAG: hypothetical protein ABFS34_03380 [Gemmatimonadota bacterium]